MRKESCEDCVKLCVRTNTLYVEVVTATICVRSWLCVFLMWTSLTQIPSSVRITSYWDAYFQGCSTNNYDNTTHDRGLKDSMTVHRTISSCQEHTEYPRKYLTSMEGKTTTYAGKNFVIGMVSEVGERSWQDKELMMWWHISTYIYIHIYIYFYAN